MTVSFLATAMSEMAEAVDYYESQQAGLGGEFAEEVKRTIQRILQYPAAGAPLSKRTRRFQTKRFPYGIIYQLRDDVVLVIAVMHLRRKPATWRARLRGERDQKP